MRLISRNTLESEIKMSPLTLTAANGLHMRQCGERGGEEGGGKGGGYGMEGGRWKVEVNAQVWV